MTFAQHLKADLNRKGLGINYLVQLLNLSYSSCNRRMNDNSFMNKEISWILIKHFMIRSDKHEKYLLNIKSK